MSDQIATPQVEPTKGQLPPWAPIVLAVLGSGSLTAAGQHPELEGALGNLLTQLGSTGFVLLGVAWFFWTKIERVLVLVSALSVQSKSDAGEIVNALQELRKSTEASAAATIVAIEKLAGGINAGNENARQLILNAIEAARADNASTVGSVHQRIDMLVQQMLGSPPNGGVHHG